MKSSNALRFSMVALVGLWVAPTYAATPESYTFQLDESVMAEEVDVPASEDPNALNFLAPGAGEAKPDAEEAKEVKAEDAAAVAPAADVAPALTPKEVEREIPTIDPQNDSYIAPNVTYVTGGVGDDERAAIEASKADYNVQVLNSSAAGAWMGDARVVVAKASGKNATEKVLSVVSGPLLYVKLPEGKYTLDASIGEMQKHYEFTVTAKKTVRIVLGWK